MTAAPDGSRLAPVLLNQLARYAPALALVEGRDAGTLLEVGSGSEGIARFAAPRWDITICDRDFSDYGLVDLPGGDEAGPTRVEADVARLPFEERAFDVVLALDLLEHVPPSLREDALGELARVTSGILIVGCPCGAKALRSDRLLARFYRLRGRRPPPWLQEHLENGFPEIAAMSRKLGEYGAVDAFPNERLGMHQAVSVLEGTPGVAQVAAWLAQRLESGIYDEAAGRRSWPARFLRGLRGWDREPSYRQFAVLNRVRARGSRGHRSPDTTRCSTTP